MNRYCTIGNSKEKKNIGEKIKNRASKSYETISYGLKYSVGLERRCFYVSAQLELTKQVFKLEI